MSFDPTLDQPDRRALLRQSATVAAALCAAGLWPTGARAQGTWPQAAFQARSLADLTRALGLPAPQPSREVTLQAPDIAENGAAVEMVIGCTAAGARRLALLVEKNPSGLSAIFDLTDAVEPTLRTRVKMAESSNVFVVAQLADGRTLYTVKDVKVTLGGCGA